MGRFSLNKNALTLQDKYYVGECQQRIWGFYQVTNVGERKNRGFCEKRIVIYPGRALSLQRHQARCEIWRVIEGQITIILDAAISNKKAGNEIDVPLGSVHTMINLGDRPVLVYEKQKGFCREGDNDRLYDMNGRETVKIATHDYTGHESIRLYKELTQPLMS